MEFREIFISKLKELLSDDTEILMAWEGGSAATGYLDEYSDVDLGIICADCAVEKTFNLIESYLEKEYGLKHRYRLPEPSWHGHAQCYYILDHTPPLFFLDLLIEKESAGNRFLESNRHGQAVIWFDRKNMGDTSPTPETETRKKIKQILIKLQDSFPIVFIDIRKLIRRGKIIDAFYAYYQMLTRMSYLYNIKYRPAKYDFGLRYTYRDFPAEIIRELESMVQVKDLVEMEKNLLELEKRCRGLEMELQAEYL
ncbi:MAG: hypothetical protein JXB60_08835 [Candidatus Cloacimonetes bacterium]|nr:hypothetical protein [Candidatus Cloacimonadota bacterium]